MPPLRESAGGRIDIGDGLSDALNSADRGKTRHRQRFDGQFAKNVQKPGFSCCPSQQRGRRHALCSAFRSDSDSRLGSVAELSGRVIIMLGNAAAATFFIRMTVFLVPLFCEEICSPPLSSRMVFR